MMMTLLLAPILGPPSPSLPPLPYPSLRCCFEGLALKNQIMSLITGLPRRRLKYVWEISQADLENVVYTQPV